MAVFDIIVNCIIVFIIVRLLHSFWRFIFEYFVAKLIGLSLNIASFGKWAVVTGATDGIGKEYAKELGKRGLNVVIIGRSQEKLDDTEEYIKKAVLGGTCEVRQIKADFTHVDALYESLGRQLQGLEIGILVNNVGMGYAYPERLMSVENVERLSTDLINVNALSVARMTELVLGDMLKRNKGIILNISSMAGQRYVPLLAMYSATKAFVKCFSESLAVEYRGKGVIIQCLTPLYVCTKMSGIKKATLAAPSASTYARRSLDSLGHSTVSYGYWPHHIQGSLQGSFIRLVPDFIYQRLVVNINSAVKAAYMRKMSKKQ